MTKPARTEARLVTLTNLLRASVKPPSVFELDRGLASLRARVAKGRARRPQQRGVLIAAALLALAGAALLLGRARAGRSKPAPPIAVIQVEGGKILDGGYLSENDGRGLRLYFSEGSRFVLTPGTRGRLHAVSAEGAKLVLDQGTVSLDITPSPERRWSVEAGPFVVSVRGTDFTVVWEPTSEHLEVKLRRGRVAVSGPVVGEEVVLRPGQHLTVDLPKLETLIGEDAAVDGGATPVGSAGPPASASAASPVVVSVPPVASAPRTVASAPGPAPRRWREALAAGRWDDILADVERAGVATSLRTLPSEDLFQLADAARYRRRFELARAALLAEVERFPNSGRALDSLFLLGRVEEARGNKLFAVERYDEYLGRAPGGTYAAEALGRKMILVKESAGPDAARELGRAYLLRFPNGSYAEVARTLAQVR